MSESGVDEMTNGVLADLEGAVDALMGRLEALHSSLTEERTRREELEELVRRIQSEGDDPSAVAHRLSELETRNADLEDRLERGREAAERLLARVRYLEEQR